MAAIFRRRVPMLFNLSLSIGKRSKRNCLFSHQLAGDDPTHVIVNSLCESLRKGLNWNSLSRKYDSTDLSDPIIGKVLLELKEPNEAKRALSFFHWVGHSKKTHHGLEHYCITIHILARACLVKDACGLLESVLVNNDENEVDDSLRFQVVNMLLKTYRITDSCPLVFDLLVQTYSKLRMLKTGFDVSCYLDEHGFSLRPGTFNTLLYSIQKSADRSDLIWKVYGHMIQKRLYPNDLTVRVMIDALCKAGELQKYVDIIDRIHGKRCSPVVIVNTSLIFRMLGEGKIEEGMVSMKRMLQKNLILDTISYSMIVYAKVKVGDLNCAREVYGEMLSRGFCPNSFVYTLFIGAYCEKGMVEEAIKLMEEMVNICLKPYNDTYNSLIIGCAKTGNLVNSTRLCEEMAEKGLLPSTSAFNEMLGKLSQGGNMKQANEMLTSLIEKGFLPDETTYCYLVDGYRRESNIQEVLKLYFEMGSRSLSPGLPIFTSLITTMCEHKRFEEAEKYLAIMKSRSLCPTQYIYELLIVAHLENGNEGRAHQLYNEMLQKGFTINQLITCSLSFEDLGR